MTKLSELIAKWRKAATICNGIEAQISGETMAECADELEAALAECEPGPSDNDLYASYANHCAIEKKLPLTFHSWKREQKK